MNNDLPSLMQNSSPISPSKVLLNEINRHTLALHKARQCINPSGNILYDNKFWQQRIHATPSLQATHDQWRRLQPLAHLNSQALIDLYQQHVIPLKRLYQYYGAQQQAPLILKKINQNLDCIKKIKNTILKGLYFRAKIHHMFDQGDHVEDVYGYFLKKLNIPITHALCCELSHDNRILIYDLLCEQSTLKNRTRVKLYQNILQNLPQQGYAPLTTLKQSVQALAHFNQTRQNTLENLGVTQLSKAQRILKIEKKNWSIKQKIMMLAGSLTVSSFLYATVASLIQPYLIVMLSQNVFHFLNQALFYSIPFAPLYGVVISTALNLTRNGIYRLFSYKVNDILKALHDLEQAHLYIHQTLSHPILDLKSFNSQKLVNTYQATVEILNQSQEKLNKTTIFQRLFFPSHLMNEAQRTLVSIERVKKKLSHQFSLLNEHLAMRMGQEIKTLHYSVTDKRLISSLSLKQLKAITQLIRTFGNKKTQQKLQDNTNVVKMWITKVAEGHFQGPHAPHYSSLQKPWGKYDIIKESLKGWQIIFENFILDENQRKAALTLVELLSDKTNISATQLQQCYQCLNLDESQIKIIDTFIFETLDSRRQEHSQLLMKDSQQCLHRWKEDHFKLMNTAITAMRDIFCDSEADFFQQKIARYDLNKLAQYNELYEINRRIDILTNSTKHDSIGAEQYFKSYNGSQSFAHLLINFLAPSQRKTMLQHIAKKRLAWMLKNINRTNFNLDHMDSDLFLDLELFEEDRFNFKKQVKNSRAFKQKNNPAMERFIKMCTERGFVNHRFLSQYQRNKKIIRYYKGKHNEVHTRTMQKSRYIL